MSRLDIDFAAGSRRGTGLVSLALLLAGAAALTLTTLELDELDQQTVVAEAKLKNLTRGMASAAATKPGGSTKDAAGSAAGEVLAQLRAPWPELLEQLEGLADLPVAVLDFDAQARGRSLRLAGEAKSMDEVLAFVEKLRQSKRLDDVFLQGHEARKVGAADVIAFTVQATWPVARDSARDAAR
jgi:Tfp pilus assembly protein PilN